MAKVVLAFSGGLDTSFCAVWLREELGAEVVTVTVDTGGFPAAEAKAIADRAAEVGSARHIHVDGRRRVLDGFISWLIRGNCLRGGVYPIAVGAERVAQAEAVVGAARDAGAGAVAHGSTGAGNDGIRFDTAFRALAPDLAIHAPVRTLALSREAEAKWLATRGIHIPAKTSRYSVNEGLWGVTIGGGETHDSWAEVPEDVYRLTRRVAGLPPEEVILSFEQGLPVALDGRRLDGLALIDELNRRAGAQGIGRGVHVGDTILGLKGRIAFEAPAAVVLVAAHRELEKLVLTGRQLSVKGPLGDLYGSLLHEGLWFDPVMRDIEALLERSQERVTGDVRVRLSEGAFAVAGARSAQSLLGGGGAAYGERGAGWSGAEAAGFARIHGLAAALAAERDRR
ncbi:MAG: argininosuccinate synthase [Planctomycetes bacterium]|nr:argininosuccinate synthase [Planctomycetota bacterium]